MNSSPRKPAASPEDAAASKRRKIDLEQQSDSNDNAPVKESNDDMETIDVATCLGLKAGDRIEVKWDINDDGEEGAEAATGGGGEKTGMPKTEGEGVNDGGNNNDSSNGNNASAGAISVWWKATVQNATGEYYFLNDDGDDAADSNDIAEKEALETNHATTAARTDAKQDLYDCPKCTKTKMSKQGLYTHYGMVHGGKLARDYPNLTSTSAIINNTPLSAAMPKRKPTAAVRLPIYKIIYDPLPSLGFPDYSIEEVGFISNVTLFNLSSEEMMNFRLEGVVGSPVDDDDGVETNKKNIDHAIVASSGGGGLFSAKAATATGEGMMTNFNPYETYKEFHSEDDIRNYMNELMQKSMSSTGMDRRMNALPRIQQNVIACRINKALEGLLGKIMEEMGKKEGGNRVVTAEVVKRCMEQMGRV